MSESLSSLRLKQTPSKDKELTKSKLKAKNDQQQE
jgi:hypothetical protein